MIEKFSDRDFTTVKMSMMKTPPTFSSKRSYERYRAELEAWTAVTSVKKESWARLIALHMPDSPEESDLRGKIFVCLILNYMK